MSSPHEEATAAEGLKFLTFFLRAYQEEFDTVLSVDEDLFAAVVDQEQVESMNLVFESLDNRVIMKAVLDEDE